MGLLDRIRRRPTAPDDEFSPMPGFRLEYGDETRFIADAETMAAMRDGRAQRSAQEQFYVLDLLVDEGGAVALPDGFAVPADVVARLDDGDAEVLRLPPRFVGAARSAVHRFTSSPDFRVDVELQVGAHPEPARRRGPVVHVGGRTYRLSVPMLRTLSAVEAHTALPRPARTESENVRLVAQLQAARRLAASSDPAVSDPGFDLPLGPLDRFSTVVPGSVGLVVEPQPDGSLAVEPDLGPSVDRDRVRTRWHQVDRHQSDDSPATTAGDASAVLRVDDTLVLLEPQQLDGVREVRALPLIPALDVSTFLRAPGSFFDPELVDVDVRFSVRVAGLGVIAPVTFTEAESSGLDWFAQQVVVAPPEALADVARSSAEQTSVEQVVSDAWERGDDVARVGEQLVDLSNRSRVAEVLEASRRRIAALELAPRAPDPDSDPEDQAAEPESVRVSVGMHIHDAVDVADAVRDRAATAQPAFPVDYASLRREPFPHQRDGIEWMTGLMQSALADEREVGPVRLQGALLADDMGLGKTFMILVALAEARRASEAAGQSLLPTLAVMPVALLENWLQEIQSTFGSQHGPFDDVVVLQGSGLADYRMRGAARETTASLDDLDEHGMVREDRIHASLRLGAGWKEARLDRPGVLVLTTYETLRRYQVSLGAAEWGVVVFDEAQATKNPEILATRAAKALNARFKLLATGTPVENSLRDIWSLVDTAQPGLLGSWAQFQETWVRPMAAADRDEHERLGRALREAIGQFMLRRVKEDHLTDLPAKHVHEYPTPMPPVQVQAYDEALGRHSARRGVKGAALKTLHELATVSLHPGLLSGDLSGDGSAVSHSARTRVAVEVILDDVRARGEKAIVFAKTKELQRAFAAWLSERYGARVEIVNGDTAATGRGETRIAKIRAFEAVDGFNVIIMSPLAVGVGLTVVEANHAIHLERHWNPAKEAQATDRVYRIGQRREVHVHYPIALHPTVDSFDVNLGRLLHGKIALKDAVVVPQEVSQNELEEALGLG
jgi:SNF2 family DNA or RNA helicase